MKALAEKPGVVTWRRFWIWLLILVVYLGIESAGFYLIPQWMGYHGGLQIFALNNPPPYSANQALTYINEYGSSGRAAYTVAMAFDVLFPFLYATVLSVGLRLVTAKLRLSPGIQLVAGVFPFIAAIANWIADIFILILLNNLSRSIAIASVASILTTLKFVVIAISILCLLVGAIYVFLVKRSS